MSVFALPFIARRRRHRTDFQQWHDASRELQQICPPTDETATAWCRVVDVEDLGREESASSDAA